MELQRGIRSFVLRQGRLTPGQQRALQRYWPTMGLDWPTGKIDLQVLFPPQRPKVLEIGCGNGEAILWMAQHHPEKDYLGIEVHRPGIGQILLQAGRLGLQNLRLIQHDARQVVEESLMDDSLDEIFILFADPWPKKRHHKRRLIQPAFVDQLVRILKPQGMLYLATDWPDYRDHILAVLEDRHDLVNLHGPGQFMPQPLSHRPETKYQRRGLRLGHGVWDLAYCHSNISK